MMTSSPLSTRAIMARNRACLPPQVMAIWFFGSYFRPFSLSNFSATALRSSMMPVAGVYLVKPLLMASMAAALTFSGVSKSGSPAPKPMMSRPWAVSSLTLAVRERVAEPGMPETSLEIFICRVPGGPSSGDTSRADARKPGVAPGPRPSRRQPPLSLQLLN